MKNFFASVCVLMGLIGLSCSALADVSGQLSGQWSGLGTWSYEGVADNCQVQMSFQQNAQTLTREKASFDCSMVQMESPAVTWSLQGSQMLLDGAVVGQWSENSFTATEKYSPTVNIQMKMTVQDNHADYSEVWSNAQGQVIYSIQARLSRQP